MRSVCVVAVGLGLGVALASGCQRDAVVGAATWLGGGGKVGAGTPAAATSATSTVSGANSGESAVGESATDLSEQANARALATGDVGDARDLAGRGVTLRVARVSRRLDGLRLVDETRRVLRAGEPIDISWTGTFRGDSRPSVTFDPPGTLVASDPGGEVTETLCFTLVWGDDGAQITLEKLGLWAPSSVQRSRSLTDGRSFGLSQPMAVTPWDDPSSGRGGRAFLIVATPAPDSDTDASRAADAETSFTVDDWRRVLAAAYAGIVDRATAAHSPLRRDDSRLFEAFALLRQEFDDNRLDRPQRRRRSVDSMYARALAFAGQRVLVVDTPGGQPTPSEAARRLDPREIAELALDAPVQEVRDAMAWLLTSEKPPRGPLAEELIELAAAQPGRVPDAVVVASKASLANDVARRGERRLRRTAYALWGVAAVFLLGTIIRLIHPDGARGMAAMLLIGAVLIAEMRIVIGGVDYLPASAGWALAAVAVWCVGRGRADNEARVAAGAFAVAAVGSVLGIFVGVTAEIASSVAALVGCLAIATLTPALLRGLAPRGSGDRAPRRPVRGSGWRLAVRATVGALLAGGVVMVAMSQSGGRSAAVMLFAAPVLALCGGVVLWRIHLARGGRARPLPLLFVVGLAVPTLVLLCGQVGLRVGPDAGSRMLPDPLDSIAYTSMAAALAFVLLRNLDAARVRGRADAAHAAASE